MDHALKLAHGLEDSKIPSKSTKQANFFAAISHSPEFARKVGVPQSVGKEFNQADAGRGIIGKKPGQKGYVPLVRKNKK